MKKKISFIITSVLIITTLFTAFVPASAASLAGTKNIVFKVANRSDRTVTLKLKGPENYTFKVTAGNKKSIQILKGDYKLEYVACGVTHKSDLSLEKNFKLVIRPCFLKMTRFRIKSHFGQTIDLRLSGHDYYKIKVRPGTSTWHVLAGWYKYTYKACYRTFSGKVHISKKGNSEMELHSCAWYADKAKTTKAKHKAKHTSKARRPATVVVKNRTSDTIHLYLIGPKFYSMDMESGKTSIEVVPGKYVYVYHRDNKLFTGKFRIKRKGTKTIIIEPASH